MLPSPPVAVTLPPVILTVPLNSPSNPPPIPAANCPPVAINSPSPPIVSSELPRISKPALRIPLFKVFTPSIVRLTFEPLTVIPNALLLSIALTSILTPLSVIFASTPSFTVIAPLVDVPMIVISCVFSNSDVKLSP